MERRGERGGFRVGGGGWVGRKEGELSVCWVRPAGVGGSRGGTGYLGTRYSSAARCAYVLLYC